MKGVLNEKKNESDLFRPICSDNLNSMIGQEQGTAYLVLFFGKKVDRKWEVTCVSGFCTDKNAHMHHQNGHRVLFSHKFRWNHVNNVWLNAAYVRS